MKTMPLIIAALLVLCDAPLCMSGETQIPNGHLRVAYRTVHGAIVSPDIRIIEIRCDEGKCRLNQVTLTGCSPNAPHCSRLYLDFGYSAEGQTTFVMKSEDTLMVKRVDGVSDWEYEFKFTPGKSKTVREFGVLRSLKGHANRDTERPEQIASWELAPLKGGPDSPMLLDCPVCLPGIE